MANTKNAVYLSDDLQKYLEQESERLGMGKSAFIAMIISHYRQEQVAMDTMSKFEMYTQKIDALEGVLNKILTDKHSTK